MWHLNWSSQYYICPKIPIFGTKHMYLLDRHSVFLNIYLNIISIETKFHNNYQTSFYRLLISVGVVGAAAPRFSEGQILQPKILRKNDFYSLDFHDFHPKIPLLSVFRSISKDLHPQSWNFNKVPVLTMKLITNFPFKVIDDNLNNIGEF